MNRLEADKVGAEEGGDRDTYLDDLGVARVARVLLLILGLPHDLFNRK